MGMLVPFYVQKQQRVCILGYCGVLMVNSQSA